MRDCRETNIGKEYSKNSLFDKEAQIPKREDKEKEQELEADSDFEMEM